jgi:signal transduction histidine kinase/CheY-like chemotaxis protein
MDGIISFEACDSGQFRIAEVNTAFELVTGYVSNQLIGKIFTSDSVGKLIENLIAKLSFCMEKQCIVEEDLALDFPIGMRQIHLTLVPFFDEDGYPYRVTAILHDNTKGKRTERALKEKDRHSQALLRLSRNLERAQSYAEIVNAALEEVRTIIGYNNLWVYLMTEDKKYADLINAGGTDSEAVMPRLTVTGDKMIEEIVSGPNYVLVVDAATDERTNKEIVAQLKNRTIVNVPIVFFGRHIGSVGMGTFGDEGIRVPNASEREFLMALASHMAVSIDRIHSMIERKKAEEALRNTNLELEKHRHNLEALVEERTHELSHARDAAESANRAKSMFLANMSHELRTPLNAILGFANLMSRDESVPEHARNNLTIINRSGEHLLAMINDVLDLSKIEAGRVEIREESFDLVRTIEDIGEMIRVRAEEKRLEVIVDIAPDAKRYIKTDLGKLRQILINLLGNAVKFTDKGGIALRVRTVESINNSAKVLLDIEIEDTGSGITRDELDIIFNPFVQVSLPRTKNMGTGLGLTISQSYAQMMGGRITVKSELGKGSVFKFQVAVENSLENTALRNETSASVVVGIEDGQPEYRILIVEDNEDNSTLLNALLTQVGFETRIARNGKEGIELAESWRPHFIWMDMKMPVMSGYEATKHIRATSWGKDMVIVAFTASVFSDQEHKILDAGCNCVIHKPFREQDIFDTMAKFMGVRYSYSEPRDEIQTQESQSDRLSIPTIEEVKSLPEETIDRIMDAAVDLNRQGVLEIANEISSTNRNVAVYLKNQASSYNFEAIKSLIASIQKKKAS